MSVVRGKIFTRKFGAIIVLLNCDHSGCQVLDEEAEVFVVKLWRLLIYETEARHLGIAKSY